MGRREDNKRMGLQEMGYENMDRVHLADDRHKWWTVMNPVMNVLMP
jgi:L-rhamnose mutarotase